MVRAAVDAGATYLSDDVIITREGRVAGLARAIRFCPVSVEEPRPFYLEGMQLMSTRNREDESTSRVPVYWPGGEAVHDAAIPDSGVVVVQVSQGPEGLKERTDVERALLLHEAAIVHAAEYDGSLGSGPTYHLTWEDPARSYENLWKLLSPAAS